ncbi:MAG: DUF4906 domain-containing protein [Bacteroidales bacterium]|nr:DUF4906 domain-containing protein [Bacteroidales bacterium]
MKRRLLSCCRQLLPALMLLSAVLAVPVGCADGLGDTVVVSGIRSRGPKLQTRLAVSPMESSVTVKSSFSGGESAEALVDDWNLLIFEDGLLKAKYYQGSADDINCIGIVGGRAYDYYALANVGDLSSDTRFTVGTTTESFIEGWAPSLTVEGAYSLPMAWKAAGVSFTLRELRDGTTLDVILSRLVARYDLVVDKSSLSKYSVTITGATLEGASAVTPFSVLSRASSSSTTTDRATPSDVDALNGGRSMTIYPLENCYGDLLAANTNTWNKKPRNISDNDHPTYIELTGTARLRDGSTFDIPVIYRFFLGQDAVSNFDVVRNTVNTVTLELSDEAVDMPDNPSNPIWKIEKGAYTDDRALAFRDESVSLTESGASLVEPVDRNPGGLNYIISWDSALDDAGMTVYAWDTASGTAGAQLVQGDVVTAGAVQLRAESVVSARQGFVRIRTLDGRLTDELAVTVGRIPVRIDAMVGTYNNDASAVRYSSSLDTMCYNLSDGFRIWTRYLVVYSDGSELDISDGVAEDFRRYKGYSPTSYTPVYLKNISLTQNVSGNSSVGKWFSMGYSTSDWFYQGGGKLAFVLYRDGVASYDVVYSEGGVEVSFATRLTHLSGRIVPDPQATTVNAGDIVPLRYLLVYGNDTQGSFADWPPVDVTGQITSFSDGWQGCLDYLGYSGGKHHFRASDYGTAEFSAAPRQVHLHDVEPRLPYDVTYGFADVRTGTVTVADNRVLDHLEITPPELYAPDMTWARNEPAEDQVHFKLYAFFTDGTFKDISAEPSASWTVHPFYYRQYATENQCQISDFTVTKDDYYPRTDVTYHGLLSYSILGGTGAFLGVLNDPSTWQPATFADVSYTLRGVTKTTSAMVSLERNVQLVSVEVSPSSRTTWAGGGQVSFTAVANFDDGSAVDITRTGTWSCDAFLRNDGNGRFTSNDLAGSTAVQVSYTHRGVTLTGTAAVDIVSRTATGIELQYWDGSQWVTGSHYVNLDSYQSYRIVVTYDMGSPSELTGGFTLSSSNPSVLSVTGTSTHAAAVGVSDVTAAYAGLASNAIRFTVQDHNYSYGLRLTPASATIPCDGTASFQAWYITYDNGVEIERDDISASASWSLSPDFTGVATVAGGTVTADNRSSSDVSGWVSAGYSSSQGSFRNYSDLTVLKPFLPALSASPASLEWDWFEGGGIRTVEISGNVAWTIAPVDGFDISPLSGTGDATVSVSPSGNNESGGYITGTLVVTADEYPLSASVSLVQGNRGGSLFSYWWSSYSISPTSATIPVGGTQRFTAIQYIWQDAAMTRLYSTIDITGFADWTTGNAGVATITKWGMSPLYDDGTAVGVSAGSVIVSFTDPMGDYFKAADYSGATASLTVLGPVYKLVTSVTRSTIAVGETTEASARLFKSFDAGMTWNDEGLVSGGFEVISGDSCVSVSGSTVTGSSAGTAVIRSTWSGQTVDFYEDASVTVAAAPATYRLVVTPSSATIPCDGTKEFTATLQAYVGGSLTSSTDVTSAASWSSSNTSAATVSGGVATGCNTSLSSVTTTISATYDGVSSSTTGDSALLSVEGRTPELLSIAFDRSHYDLVRVTGRVVVTGHSFALTAYYEDNRQETVTASANYSDQGFVAVSGAAGTLTPTGACSGKTLTASYGGKTATATYSAQDIAYPSGLTDYRLEAQGGSQREFIVESLDARVVTAITSSTTTEDVISEADYSIEGPVTGGGYQGGRGRVFRFSSPGTAWIRFTYTLNGISVDRTLQVQCGSDNEITHRWYD